MSWFHAKEGWMFRREPYGSVTIEKRSNDRRQVPEMDVSFDAETWASIVASVCAEGENGTTFGKALEFHINPKGVIRASVTHGPDPAEPLPGPPDEEWTEGPVVGGEEVERD